MESAQQIIDNLNKNLPVLQAYVEQELVQGNTVGGKQITDKCKELGIDHNRFISRVKEAIEISLMHAARAIATDRSITIRQRYDEIVGLYNRQPVVGAKMTLNQMTKEQYSTSLPVAYLMSEFVKDGDATNWNCDSNKVFFEPSAGNGFLTIALPQEQTICNEIDENRLANLRSEHYRKVTDQDALQPFNYGQIFDGVITNPPFLRAGGTEKMIFNALATMKDNGRCAIIRDGWNQFENYYNTMQRSKFNTFYDRLFTEYNVVKIINLNSYDVYAKQGTGFPMQLILIVGRNAKRRTDTKYRVFNPDIDKTEKADFEKLWEYFENYFPLDQRQQGTAKFLTFRQALKLKVTRLQQMANKDEWNCNGEAERANRLMARHIFNLYKQNMLTIENDYFKADDTLIQWHGQPIPHRAVLFKKEIELMK